MTEEGVFYEKCPNCGSYKTEYIGTEAGDSLRRCKECQHEYLALPWSYPEFTLQQNTKEDTKDE